MLVVRKNLMCKAKIVWPVEDVTHIKFTNKREREMKLDGSQLKLKKLLRKLMSHTLIVPFSKHYMLLTAGPVANKWKCMETKI